MLLYSLYHDKILEGCVCACLLACTGEQMYTLMHVSVLVFLSRVGAQASGSHPKWGLSERGTLAASQLICVEDLKAGFLMQGRIQAPRWGHQDDYDQVQLSGDTSPWKLFSRRWTTPSRCIFWPVLLRATSLALRKYTAHRRHSVSVTPTGLPSTSFYTEDLAKALGRCRHKLWGIHRTGRTGQPGVDRPKPILPHHLPLSRHDTVCERLWQHRTNDCLEKTYSPQGDANSNPPCVSWE